MLDVAEARLARGGPGGQRTLTVWADSADGALQAVLAARGYARDEGPEFQRRQPITGPITPVPPPPGYTVRALGDASEHPARSWASWRAFHPNDPPERYQGHSWYANVQRVPLYRRDLDIIAVAPDGSHAAFCTCWLDDVCRTATFEPVGTVPEHQKLGLGKAVMTEALRRVQILGADLAFVGGYSVRANALYTSVGFKDYDLSETWLRVF
jgi:GNAT superfamily N-acetyltransferase